MHDTLNSRVNEQRIPEKKQVPLNSEMMFEINLFFVPSYLRIFL